MAEIPKAQVGAIRELINSDIIVALIICGAIVGSFSQLRQCYVGEDVARAKCVTAGGEELKCCEAFTHGGGAWAHLKTKGDCQGTRKQ